MSQCVPCWSEANRRRIVVSPRVLHHWYRPPPLNPRGGSDQNELRQTTCWLWRDYMTFKQWTISVRHWQTYCQSNWCHPLTPVGGWTRLSVLAGCSSPDLWRIGAASPQRHFLWSWKIKEKIERIEIYMVGRWWGGGGVGNTSIKEQPTS